MSAATWRSMTAQLAASSRNWVQQRQGQDSRELTLHSRRIYILPTRAGLVFGAVIVILLISSMNFSNNMGFALTFLLTGIGLVCMHHCHRNLNGLRICLSDTESGFAGTQVAFQLRLHNAATEPRWQLAAGWDRAGTENLSIAANDSSTVMLTLPAADRGLIRAPRISISTSFPLGLFRAWCWLHIDAAAVVWPRAASHAERPPAQGELNDTGNTAEERGDDLSGVRNYRDGDSPRRIDWKALARRGDLLVREYHDGTTSNIWLDWDALPELPVETRLAVLTRLALDAHADGNRWGLRMPGICLPPEHSDHHLENCLDQLALYGIAPATTGSRP